MGTIRTNNRAALKRLTGQAYRALEAERQSREAHVAAKAKARALREEKARQVARCYKQREDQLKAAYGNAMRQAHERAKACPTGNPVRRDYAKAAALIVRKPKSPDASAPPSGIRKGSSRAHVGHGGGLRQ